MRGLRLSVVTLLAFAPSVAAQDEAASPASRSPSEVMASSADEEWRPLDPESTVYLDLPEGRVVVELAPWAAPRHVENVRALVRGGFFDGGAVERSQDNYVVQWGSRPLEEGESLPPHIAATLPAEFEVPAEGLAFTALPDGDVYAPEAGFVRGFPVGRDPEAGVAWIAHCYGVVAVSRGNDPDSGNGSGLYVVIGHAPRHLDRNLTVVGRVVEGIEHLSTLPRGTGSLGFYETREERTPIAAAAMGSDLPPEERAGLELLDTDSPSFSDLLLAARSRVEEFFVHSPDRLDLCNARLPARPVGGT